MKSIQLLLTNQESWIINDGTITKDFKLEKGTAQGDSASAYLFILVLEIAFRYIKENKKVLISLTAYFHILLMLMMHRFL